MVTEIVAEILIVELGITITTTVPPAPPTTIDLDAGTYTLRATNPATGETLPDEITTISEAVTTREDFYFTAAPPPEYTLTISTSPGGYTQPPSGPHVYDEGTVVSVMAIAYDGYYFDYWELDGAKETTTPISVIMNEDHNLKAFFSEEAPPPPRILDITTAVGGSTDPTPGIHEYPEGTVVTVTAIPVIALPGERYYFNHWELNGDVRTENPITITMTQDYTLHAYFSTEPPPPPEIDLATIAAVGLATADAVLIGIYIATLLAG